MIRRPPRSTRTDTLFPYTTLFRSSDVRRWGGGVPASWQLRQCIHAACVVQRPAAPGNLVVGQPLAVMAALGLGLVQPACEPGDARLSVHSAQLGAALLDPERQVAWKRVLSRLRLGGCPTSKYN